MKAFLFLSAVLMVALAAEEKYTTKYDNIDLGEILNNDRLLNKYVDCLLDKGACTPDGAELKKNIPDALQTECFKCNEKQKEGVEKVIRFLIENRKDDWEKMLDKYDPDRKYNQKYQSEAEKHHIKV